MEQKKKIGNVGTLDLRKATEASIAEIRSIGNVGTLLHSRETAGLLTRLNIGNVGSTMEVSPDAKIITGRVVFNRDYFKDQGAPIDLFVTGSVIVEPDVPAEDIETGLGELNVTGSLVCPEHLMGKLQSKTQHLTGSTATYAASGQVTLGSLVLDENYLRGLADGSDLVVVGSLRLPKVLPDDLLAQKIQRLQVTGKIRCHEENAQTLAARLADKSVKVKTIPVGYELVERPLVLDGALLEALPSNKLYCTDRVQIAADVTSAALDKGLEGLISEDLILCPTGLKSVLAQKCNLLETRAVFYEGTLWVEDSARDLLPSDFDYLEGQITLVVFGAVKVDPGVDPQVLTDRLAKVHNFGAISCTPEQMGAIQARLGLSDGVLSDSTKKEDSETDEGQIGNLGYLAL